MMGKVERAMARSKRLEKLKAMAGQYEKTVPPETLDKGLKSLLKMIREM